MDANRVAEDAAAAFAAVDECWPDGVVEEFDTDESYFYDIHEKLERDLRKIPEAELLWQTETEPERACSYDDDDGPAESGADFQSHHVFFLSPNGLEFEFETEIEGLEEPEDPEDPYAGLVTVAYPGTGHYGCSVAVSLATPFAAVGFADYARFEDGSDSAPDPCYSGYCNRNGEPVDLAASCQELGAGAFAKLEKLRARIATVLAKHGVVVLDQAVLDLPAPGLKPESDVFLDGPLSVWDAFFFRGV